jgi:hypothetical protein
MLSPKMSLQVLLLKHPDFVNIEKLFSFITDEQDK